MLKFLSDGCLDDRKMIELPSLLRQSGYFVILGDKLGELSCAHSS